MLLFQIWLNVNCTCQLSGHINQDTPVFAASKNVIKCVGKCNTTDEIENAMMPRSLVLNFTQPIACDNEKGVSPCSKCFTELFQLAS